MKRLFFHVSTLTDQQGPLGIGWMQGECPGGLEEVCRGLKFFWQMDRESQRHGAFQICLLVQVVRLVPKNREKHRS